GQARERGADADDGARAEKPLRAAAVRGGRFRHEVGGWVRRRRRRRRSRPHHPARNSTADAIKTMPTVLTNVERTSSRRSEMDSTPSVEVTSSFNGNVPDVRVSTETRTVVLRGGSWRSSTVPWGKNSLSLERAARRWTGYPVPLRNVNGI